MLQSSTWHFLSELFGTLSLCIWLCAQIPQIYANYRNRSVSGLSLGFLAVWAVGDTSGLAGCILTNQLGFQTTLACYYVVMDVILASQYFLYTRVVALDGVAVDLEDRFSAPRKKASDTYRGHSSSHRPNSLASAATLSTLAAGAHALVQDSSSGAAPLFVVDVGFLCAYVSSTMYVISRVPQIVLNFRRRSTTGVSVLLFSATLFGNICYTASILCRAQSVPSAAAFLRTELPYIIGSAGTVMFDVVILFQMYIYRWQEPKIASVLQPLMAKMGSATNKTSLLLSCQSIYSGCISD